MAAAPSESVTLGSPTRASLIAAELRAAVWELVSLAAILIITGLALAGVASAEWWRVRRSVWSGLSASAVRDDLRTGLVSLVAVGHDAMTIEFLHVAVESLLRIAVIILTGLLSARFLKLVLDWVVGHNASYLVQVHTTHRFDRDIMPKWWPYSIAVFIGLVIVAVAALRWLPLVRPAPLLVCLIAMLATSLLALLVHLGGSHLRGSAAARYVTWVNSPHRRLRLYIDASAWLLIGWLFAERFLPWVLDAYRAFPELVYRRGVASLGSRAHDSPVAIMAQRAGGETAALWETVAGNASESLSRLRRELMHAVTEYEPTIRQSLDQIGPIIATVFVLVMLAAAIAPWAVLRHAEAGWPGIARSAPSIVRPMVAVLPAVPVVYFVDRLGISSSRPATWLLAVVAVALTDSLLSRLDGGPRPAFVVSGGTRYHVTRDCQALAHTPSARVHRVRRREAVALGLIACTRCSATELPPDG